MGGRSEAPELVALARLRPGDMALDVASATSETAVVAAQQVGPEGRVLVVNVGAGAGGAGRTGAGQRVTQMGFGNVEFVESEGTTLELPGTDFAAAVSSLGLVLVDEPESLLRSVQAHVVPGGRVAVSVWAAPHKVPLVDVALDALGAIEPPEDLFRFADPDALHAAMADAALHDVTVVATRVVSEFPAADDYADFALHAVAPVSDLAARTADEAREGLRAAVRDAAEARCVEGGVVRFENDMLLAVGTVG